MNPGDGFGRDVAIAVAAGIAIKWLLVALTGWLASAEAARIVALPGVGLAIGAGVLITLRALRARRSRSSAAAGEGSR